MADRDRIIEKVKKCLRLSASTNQHEAAAALRQARALMNEYGLTEAEILAAGASEARGRSRSSKNPPQWEVSLASVISDAFGCEMIFVSRLTEGQYAFIGCGAAPDIAQHAYVVLVRRARKARAAYIAQNLRRCTPASRTARADVYCLGWVVGVKATVQKFAGTPAEDAAIAAYVQKHYPSLGDLKPRNRLTPRVTARSGREWGAGRRDGEEVSMHRPVGAELPDALPGGAA